MRVAGCDLGKASAKFVVGRVSCNGTFDLEAADTVDHKGQPMQAFGDWYRLNDIQSCSELGITGQRSIYYVAGPAGRLGRQWQSPRTGHPAAPLCI